MKHAKFIFLTLLLLFARGCDFYSTSLWFFDEGGKAGEQNPLTRLFDVGWNGLIIVNVLVISLVIILLYFFYYRYQRPIKLNQEPGNYKAYASLLYFGVSNKFYKVFFSQPKHKKPFYAHVGYVMTVSIIICSFLATIHNLSQYYNLSYYNHYREVVGRPLYVLYGLFLLAFWLTTRHLLRKEYKWYTQHSQKIKS